MKLYVDDIREAPEGYTLARTVTEAIRAIAKFPFEEISLDHDISHEVRIDGKYRPFPSPECFCAVAYFIGQKYILYDSIYLPKITIHSANLSGSDEIRAILKDYGLESTYIQGKPAYRKK